MTQSLAAAPVLIADRQERRGRKTALPSSSATVGEPDGPMIEYGKSSEGFLVARVDEISFAMIPTRNGGHYLATGWRISRSMDAWTRADFYGHSGDLADEAAFRARVEENAEHQRERKALGRIQTFPRVHTPWGVSQGATVYAEGVICHSTASHGGFHLSAKRNRNVPALLRAKDGHYEEDSAWAIVAITFPRLFTSFERRCAERTIKDFWPDAWEAISGTILAPGESHEKDRRAFEKQHAGDWVVSSAINSRAHSGRVEVVATLGGKRGADIEQRRFLVPSSEYAVGRFGFVIDPDRHERHDGASSFAIPPRRAMS